MSGYWVLYAICAAWVFFDAKRRQNSLVGWPLGTFLLGPLVLPVYLASRNLRTGERREGGKGWNIVKNFALFWTITLIIVGGISVVGGVASVDPASDAEMAGAAIGVTLIIGLLAAVWFFPMVGALLLGVFLKQGNLVEQGPIGPLAKQQPVEVTA